MPEQVWGGSLKGRWRRRALREQLRNIPNNHNYVSQICTNMRLIRRTCPNNRIRRNKYSKLIEGDVACSIRRFIYLSVCWNGCIVVAIRTKGDSLFKSVFIPSLRRRHPQKSIDSYRSDGTAPWKQNHYRYQAVRSTRANIVYDPFVLCVASAQIFVKIRTSSAQHPHKCCLRSTQIMLTIRTSSVQHPSKYCLRSVQIVRSIRPNIA